MFTPFYAAFLALAMMGSVISPTAATADTASKTTLVSVVSDCPYHVNCPDYPDCTPALDGTGNRWGQDASDTSMPAVDSTDITAGSSVSSSTDSVSEPGYGNGICARDGSCAADCPNDPDCEPAQDGSGNQWGHHSNHGQGQSGNGHHGFRNR